ncbi:nuclear transport factor 2 family protein [Roseibium sp.]|uniref:nuclear transport factor 2 family protein n=1 Tax=Roseibium sp. TaxID=1936156 RepID=UPI003A9800D9
MKKIVFWALAAQLVASSSGVALAQTAPPKGSTFAPDDVKALHSYAPATNPGDTGFNAADRAAIANQIYAYSFAYDNYEADAWFSLFTPDAVFVAGVPGEKALSFTGEGFHAFWRERMKEFSTSGNVRRHLMSNILFLEQTANTAHVSVVGLLTNAKDGKSFTAVSSLNYEGWLVKGPDGWKIKRWHDFPDAQL